MRRAAFFMIIITGIVCFAIACARSDEVRKTETELYFADAEINRLLPYSVEITDADSEHMARSALELLIKGRDNNEKIRRLLPDDKDCASVRVEGQTAYVDLSSDIASELPMSRDIEKMLIYQIVDTMTRIKGIRFVRFTVDGTVKKDFMGFYDMRETFCYTYPE